MEKQGMFFCLGSLFFSFHFAYPSKRLGTDFLKLVPKNKTYYKSILFYIIVLFTQVLTFLRQRGEKNVVGFNTSVNRLDVFMAHFIEAL